MHSIGQRVLQRINEVCPDGLHRDIASDVGMTPDAFSRAVGDKRQFSSLELARVADRLSADLHWLITGDPDPNRLAIAARHDFDFASGRRDVPGRSGDEQIIEDIALAYRQAYDAPDSRESIPDHADAVRELLGKGFVRPLADRIEDHLGIDVVRVAELSTAYSFSVGGRRVIALKATGNWFWENWSMAHELGHLALGHHDDDLGEPATQNHEAAANKFAAELLLPAEHLAAIGWADLGEVDLAELIWKWGVSTEVLARRLGSVLDAVPEVVLKWAEHPTQRLLRRHLVMDSGIDEITHRMDAASQRRFPLALQEAHLQCIASGALGKGTLAWMLGIDAEALDVDAPDVVEAHADDLEKALGL